jgi:serine/threonine-protein kinase HipA
LSDEPLVADSLLAWLYGTPVARLTRRDNQSIGVEWDQAALDRWSLGSRVLSVALPIGNPIGPRDARGFDFFENLLPEGPAIEMMARIAGVSRYDTFGILAAFGEDCAGAIVIIPDGRSLDASERTTYLPMTSDDLADAIRRLDTATLGLDRRHGY